MKVIITGVTGMVGEAVLLECLRQEQVSEVLSISRKPYPIQHPKLKTLIVPDFTQLATFREQISGYDACFFCAGISSVGMKELRYHHITYTTTLAFAEALLAANDQAVFCFISGQGTDSTEKGRIMWARVKGATENALMRLAFRGVYNFRPGVMLPFKGQRNAKTLYVIIARIMQLLAPSLVLRLDVLARAMIHAAAAGAGRQVLEIRDIKALAAGS